MIPGSANPLLLATAGAGAAYEIPRSVRFNSADSAYLSKTFASAGNRKTWTWAGWVKRSGTTTDWLPLFQVYDGSSRSDSNFLQLTIYSDQIGIATDSAWLRRTQAVYRDYSAWMHVVCAFDTTQATGPDRVKIYVNGSQVTAFAASSDPTQNTDYGINRAVSHQIGQRYGGQYFNGYLADINFIDGQALDPTSFGEFDTNNVWQPIAYSGSYGTNGFHLDFADNSSAAALGYDAAGSNDWTVNNLSVTAGAGNDSLVDSPTNGTQTDTGAGGEVVGNYCTLNPNNQRNSITLSNGNLDLLSTTTTYAMSAGTIACVEKTYFEVRVGGPVASGRNAYFGVGSNGDINRYNNNYLGSDALGWSLGHDGSGIYYISHNGSFTSQGGTAVAGDILMFAVDPPNGRIWFGRNGTWYAGNPAAGTGASYTNLPSTVFPILQGYNTGPHSANFGQRPFAYTAPSGFKALCTANLPAPTIEDGSTVFDIVNETTSVAGSPKTISGLAFSPDLVISKLRNQASNARWGWIDTVRGVNKTLASNFDSQEVTSQSDLLTQFNSDGFNVGADAGGYGWNYQNGGSLYTYWAWDGGTSTVTNTDGTMTANVRANTSAGISIIDFSATSGTVGHGLGVAPDFFIYKYRAGTSNWSVYHKSLGNTQRLLLNLTNAATTSSTYWNNTSPTSSVITLGSNFSGIGSSVIWAFASVSGFSSFGSYVGNGSADGPFVFTNFRPRWILLKSTAATYFMMYDTARNSYNVTNTALYPGLNNADTLEPNNQIDILSNGFKVRAAGGSNPNINPNGTTVVFAAFAEHPFSLARAR